MQVELEHLTTKNVLANLGVSLTTLRRASELLRDVMPEKFDKAIGDHGYSPTAYRLLTAYFKLRSQGMNCERAAQFLKTKEI